MIPRHACTLSAASILFLLASPVTASTPIPPDPPACETEGCPNDGNACTAPAECTETGCVTSPEPVGSVCDYAGSGDGFCDDASICVECMTDTDCPSDGNDCTGAVCADNTCNATPGPAGTSCDLGAFFSDGVCDGSGGCTPLPPLLTQGAATCFPEVYITAHVRPGVETRIYRDGVQVQSVVSNPIGLVQVTDGNDMCLVPGDLHSYQVSYVDSSGIESTLSGVRELIIADNPPVCPDPGACDEPDCKGGLTGPPGVAPYYLVGVPDTASPVSVTVSSTHPGMTVQFEVSVNTTGRIYMPIGEPVVTSAPVCVNGQPVYQGTADLTFPDDVWNRGFMTFRGRTQGDASTFLTPYSDWDSCVAENSALAPEMLFDVCEVRFGGALVTVLSSDGDFYGQLPPTPTASVTDIGCNRATLGDGTRCFLDGLPLDCGPVKSLMPGVTYVLRSANVNNEGVVGSLSAPVSFTTPDCGGSIAFGVGDGALDLGIALVTFSEFADEVPFTRQEVEDLVFNNPDSSKAWLEEVSRDRATLTGAVLDWAVLPGGLSDYCLQVITTPTGEERGLGCWDGIQAVLGPKFGTGGQFEHTFVIPHRVSVGRFYSDNWSAVGASVRGDPRPGMHHEALGHGIGVPSLGNNHAGSLHCPSGFPSGGATLAFSNGCTMAEYGDRFDPLGSSQLYHFNTLTLQLYGWLDSAETETAASIDGQSTEHWLGAITSTTYSIKQVRIPLDQGGILFLEFRNDDGFNGLGDGCSECDPPLGEASPPMPTGVQLRLRLPVMLDDWKTPAPVQPRAITHFLYKDETGTPVVLNTENPSFEDLGVAIEVLEENNDGIRIRVDQ